MNILRVLYIGQYTIGTTSKMRADRLQQILAPQVFDVVDTHIPFFKTHRLFRSLGFRYAIGPMIWNINGFVLDQLGNRTYDLIWVDKGVFLKVTCIKVLKQRSQKLVHFTPDMAFFANKSQHFKQSLNIYDFLITTKTKELSIYKQYVPQNKIILTTQGFDKNIHYPRHDFLEKSKEVVFIGLGEPSRYQVAQLLLDNSISLTIVGYGWDKFVKNNKDNPLLNFKGQSVFGPAYADLISSAQFSIGLLSKRFPELHTTRTFEIPACGTALITERNKETLQLFKNDEVLFFDDYDELTQKLKYFMSNPIELEELIGKGHEKVVNGGFEYGDILSSVIERIYSQN